MRYIFQTILTVLLLLTFARAEEEALAVEAATPKYYKTAHPEGTTNQVTWVDKVHDGLYSRSHGAVKRVDGYFVPEGEDPLPVPPPRFRIGLYSQLELEAEGGIDWAPVADFSTDIDLPNIERKLKLVVTTKDPTQLPGDDAFEADTGLRIGAVRSWKEDISTSVGVKTKWPPEAFAYAQWTPQWKYGSWWTVYPRIKPFWESDEKLGGIGSVVFDRWKNRWDFRQTFSMKWSQKNYEEDRNRSEDPEHVQFGDDGQGWRWESSSMYGLVTKLLDERDYGRRVNGDDVADAYAIRALFKGNLVEMTEARLSFFRKGGLYKDFLYYVIGPEVVWEDEFDWEEAYVLKLGIEMLFWGD